MQPEVVTVLSSDGLAAGGTGDANEVSKQHIGLQILSSLFVSRYQAAVCG